jgi:pyruvate,water dikinase
MSTLPGSTTDRTAQSQTAPGAAFIKWFADTTIDDVPLVGGKNASLGEMYRELGTRGVNVPNGFSVTAQAYRYFLRTNGIDEAIAEILAGLDTRDMEGLRTRALQARQAILGAPLPNDLESAIVAAYEQLRGSDAHPPDVAVRSSATAEDLPDASFAGQQEKYLNVQGPRALVETCRRCFASLFTDRAISYRVDKGFDHEKGRIHHHQLHQGAPTRLARL